AQVQNDLVELANVPAHSVGRGAGDVAVGGAVEAVLADRVLLSDAAVDGVRVRLLGHALVEGGVEYRDVRHVGECLARRADTRGVGGVVQRSEDGEKRNGTLDLVIDDGRGGELAAALDHAVAHIGELVEVDLRVRLEARDDRPDYG